MSMKKYILQENQEVREKNTYKNDKIRMYENYVNNKPKMYYCNL